MGLWLLPIHYLPMHFNPIDSFQTNMVSRLGIALLAWVPSAWMLCKSSTFKLKIYEYASLTWTRYSLSASRALVASSNSKTLGSIRSALAIAILCFWPPESLNPRSPTTVRYFSGKFSMKSWALAIFCSCRNSVSIYNCQLKILKGKREAAENSQLHVLFLNCLLCHRTRRQCSLPQSNWKVQAPGSLYLSAYFGRKNDSWCVHNQYKNIKN